MNSGNQSSCFTQFPITIGAWEIGICMDKQKKWTEKFVKLRQVSLQLHNIWSCQHCPYQLNLSTCSLDKIIIYILCKLECIHNTYSNMSFEWRYSCYGISHLVALENVVLDGLHDFETLCILLSSFVGVNKIITICRFLLLQSGMRMFGMSWNCW